MCSWFMPEREDAERLEARTVWWQVLHHTAQFLD